MSQAGLSVLDISSWWKLWSGQIQWMTPAADHAVWRKMVFACVASTSFSALSWEIFNEQNVYYFDLGSGIWIWGHVSFGEGMNIILQQTLWPSIGISHRSICTLQSTSSRYMQYSSRTNTSVSSVSTRIISLPELAVSVRQKIVANTLPNYSIVTCLFHQYLSCTERRLSPDTHVPGSDYCSCSSWHTNCVNVSLITNDLPGHFKCSSWHAINLFH